MKERPSTQTKRTDRASGQSLGPASPTREQASRARPTERLRLFPPRAAVAGARGLDAGPGPLRFSARVCVAGGSRLCSPGPSWAGTRHRRSRAPETTCAHTAEGERTVKHSGLRAGRGRQAPSWLELEVRSLWHRLFPACWSRLCPSPGEGRRVARPAERRPRRAAQGGPRRGR